MASKIRIYKLVSDVSKGDIESSALAKTFLVVDALTAKVSFKNNFIPLHNKFKLFFGINRLNILSVSDLIHQHYLKLIPQTISFQ